MTGQRIDIPSRMFNPGLWPNLVRFYDALGVDFGPVDASQSYGKLKQRSFLKLGKANLLENLPNLVSESKETGVPDWLASATKLVELANSPAAADQDLGLAEFLARHQISSRFVHRFLFPLLASTVCTCSYTALARYPAAIILAGMQQIMTAPLQRSLHGTRQIVRKLAESGFEIRLNSRVVSAIRESKQVKVRCDESTTGDACSPTTRRFDHVFLAVQANHVASICPDLQPIEKNTLSQFSYETVSVVVHKDPRFMPVNEFDWATFNMLMDDEEQNAMCSVWLNQFYDWQPTRENVFQTIMPLVQMGTPEKLVSSATLQRPVVTAASNQLWENLSALHATPERRLWFVGSYAEPGIPLLESGLNSAIQVASRFGIAL